MRLMKCVLVSGEVSLLPQLRQGLALLCRWIAIEVAVAGTLEARGAVTWAVDSPLLLIVREL